jgi:hypothetical protein
MVKINQGAAYPKWTVRGSPSQKEGRCSAFVNELYLTLVLTVISGSKWSAQSEAITFFNLPKAADDLITSQEIQKKNQK